MYTTFEYNGASLWSRYVLMASVLKTT